MTTTIREFIDMLNDIAEQYGDDTQIIAAHQPGYPLAEMVSGVTVTPVNSAGMIDDEDDDEFNTCEVPDCDEHGDVYDLDNERLLCSKHAAEFGVEADTMGNIAWLVLSGHPDGDSGCLWQSPYAPNVWDESLGEFFTV